MSERDGWNHLYLYDGATGRVKNQITKGEWVVRSVVKVDDDKRQIWFTASGMYPGKDPYFTHYYRIDFDGANLTTLTEADANHDVRFSSDMAFYVDTYSRVDLPNVSELRRTSDRSLLTTLEKAGHLGADCGRLQGAGSVRRQGPRWQDRHLGRHRAARRTSIRRRIPGDREHLRRAAQLVRAEDVVAVRPAFIRRQGHRHAADGGDGLHRRADGRHGHDESLQGVPRRRVEERRRRGLSRSHPVAQGGRREVSGTTT